MAKVRASTVCSGREGYTRASVVIIGAGISGICMAIDLLRRTKSRDFVIFEKSSGLGGTWRDNRYPGCCCDGKLTFYSFEQNPGWTREYAGQEEILDYLLRVAHKYDLYRYIRFNTSVEKTNWDDKSKTWNTTVQVQGGKDAEFGRTYTIKSDFLVSAVGQLNIPRVPNIDGLPEFEGKVMHSARWDWTYDLKGKKVAIIGSGSTSAQITPEVAKVVESLTVFQRTPNWVVPRMNADIPAWRRYIYQYLPIIREAKRSRMWNFRETTFANVVKPTDETSEQVKALCLAHMHAQLQDNESLWQQLTPDYRPGCKRIIVSDDFYPTFLRQNVKLETRPISRVSPTGIVVEGDEQNFDLIILATGFKTVDFMYPIEVTGHAGKLGATLWQNGAEALYGICVESLPNFAMLYGPNTNLSHNSIILMIEAQSRYIAALIKAVSTMRAADAQFSIEPKAARVKEYNAGLQADLATTAYADPGCNSWYKLDGSGKITNNWSKTVLEYQHLVSRVVWADYQISGSESGTKKACDSVEELGRAVEEFTIRKALPGLSGYTIAAALLFLALRN
ncbi:hypothetical protein AYO21_08900 [Fonsecaea monophora]|uniref:Uncharacterized protein n=1 Tax=Fonsecaea monophora TaxID=254056 RepID=A0A177F154_9EURO|nr:hypothetical protein AYO21_08900 [Fonsecaea monophora]OAG36939.1 hypothetical protein AYO21_08900 [Fonsecaea monophora]